MFTFKFLEVKTTSGVKSALLLFAICVTTFFFSAESAYAQSAWSSSSYTEYDVITISSARINDVLADFPVYVNLADLSSNFWTTTPSGASVVATDIRVTDMDNNEIPREIVKASSTTQTGELHFKAPSISATENTQFKIWYNGNTDGDYATNATYGAENVWTNKFIGVWHLDDGDSTAVGFYKDSTKYSNDATLTDADGDAAPTTASPLGGGFAFTGDGDVISTPEDVSLFFASTTISFLADATTTPGASDESLVTLVESPSNGEGAAIRIKQANQNVRFEARVNNGGTSYTGTESGTDPVLGVWRHYAGTVASTTLTQYQDGSQAGTNTPAGGAPLLMTDPLVYIGNNRQNNKSLSGAIDSVRIASTSRSASWIAAEYDNLINAQSFYYITTKPDNPWNGDEWNLFDEITIAASNIDETLTNFPVYVNLADLSGTFWSTTPTATGLTATDIRITNSNNEELPRELVFASSTLQTGELHFRADSISSTTDTTFRIWYNGSTEGDYAATTTYGAYNVWSNNFVAVFHMEEDPSGSGPQVFDSTGNNNNGTSFGSMTSTDSVSGVLGNGIDFDGSDDYINVGDTFPDTLGLSMSSWVTPNTLGEGNFGRFIENSRFRIGMRGTARMITTIEHVTTDGEWSPGSNSVPLGETTHIFTTLNDLSDTSEDALIYINGVAQGTSEANTPDGALRTSGTTYIGNNAATSRAFDGVIDELRFSSVDRSASWVKAEHLNQATSTDFYTITSPTITAAIPGDFLMRGNTNSTVAISGSSTLSYDTTRGNRGSSIGYSAGEYVLDAGKYLVMYSEGINGDTSDTDNDERVEVLSRLLINGVETQTGAGQAFIRGGDGTCGTDCVFFGIAAGAGIIDVAANSTLQVQLERTDNTTTRNVTRFPNWGSGVSILTLDDSWNYGRYLLNTDQAAATTGSWSDVTWDAAAEEDAGFSQTAGDITITNAGRYLVTYSLPITGSTDRTQYSSRMTLDGVEVQGTRVSTYIRGFDGTNDGVLTYIGVIDVSANDILTVENRKDEGISSTFESGGSIQIVQLPAGNETFIAESTTGNINPSTLTEFAHDSTPHIDTGGFTDTSATDSIIESAVADDYLMFLTQYADSETEVRMYPSARISVNDSIQPYASAGEYCRGTGNAVDCGYSTGILLPNLSAGDDISIVNQTISQNTSVVDNNHGSFSGIRLGSLFPEDDVQEWNAVDWTQYDTITINAEEVSRVAQRDIPIYIDLADLSSNFWSTTPSGALAGTDIRVTTGGKEIRELPRELVFASSTAQTGELHFNADFVSSDTNTTFRIYYNGTTTGDYLENDTYGAQNVWGDNFVGVWHLGESPSTAVGTFRDSTASNNDGTLIDTDGDTSRVAGQIGNAIQFNGDADYIEISDILPFEYSGTNTKYITIWGKPDASVGQGGLISIGAFQTGEEFSIHASGTSELVANWNGSGNSLAADSAGVGEWDRAYMSYSGGAALGIDTNGQSVFQFSGVTLDTTNDDGLGTRIGVRGNGSPDYYDGAIDEVRLFASAPPVGFIETTNSNHSSTSLFYSVNVQPKEWNSTDWQLYETITIDATQVDDDLIDFPVYVNLDDLSNGFWSTTPADSSLAGTDIRVTTADASPIELPREIVEASSTTEVGEMHFKAPLISSTTDTVFRIYYNGTTTGDYAKNATYGGANVWTNGFVGVWHLNNQGGGTGSFKDSTIYENNANNGADLIIGKMGSAREFNSSFDEILLPSSSSTDLIDNGDWTISAWSNWVPDGNAHILIAQEDGAGTGDYAIAIDGGEAVCTAADSFAGGFGSGENCADVTAQDKWSLVHTDVSDLGGGLYITNISVDGTAAAGKSTSFSGNNDGGNWVFGNDKNDANDFFGILDEVRFATTTRTAAWIAAEYTNQATSTDFYTVGDTLIISGTLYENDGVTPRGAGYDVVAALSQASSTRHQATTDSSGNYSIEVSFTGGFANIATTSGTGVASTFKDVAYGNGIFVAVGDSGDRVMTSYDGVSWTSRTAAGDNDDWNGVTYGNGLFVAVGDSGDRVMTSPDGINWTTRSAAGDNDTWFDVAYGNGQFVAVGTFIGGTAMTSPDGINWTERSVGDGSNEIWLGVTYGDGQFVAVGDANDDSVMTSPDGVTWTAHSAAGDNDIWEDVTYGDGVYVAVGVSGDRLMTSLDGVNWATSSVAENDDSWRAVSYIDGVFFAVANSGDDRIIFTRAPLGTWTPFSFAGNDDGWYGIAHGNGRTVIVDGQIGDATFVADNPYGENTPITLFVDANDTTSSSTATTLTFGPNLDDPRGITVDLVTDTVLLQQTFVASTSNEIWLSDTFFYDSTDDSDILFTATTSTTTINADFRIASGTIVYAPQNLVIDGDFDNQGTFYAERGEVVADSDPSDVLQSRFTGVALDVSNEETDSRAMLFNNDGTILYVLGDVDDDINEYPLAVPYDVQSYTSDTSIALDITTQENAPRAMLFNNDGASLYVLGAQVAEINEYPLPTPYDISSYTSGTSIALDVSGQDTFPHDMIFNNDGSSLYLLGSNGDDITEYPLPTPYDISSYTSGVNVALSVNSEDSSPRGIIFNNDGSSLYLVGNSGDDITEYPLPTSYDISSYTSGSRIVLDLSTQETEPRDVLFSNDFSTLYVIGNSDVINQYQLDDIQTLTGNFSATSSLWDLTVGDTATVSPATVTEIDNNYHVGGSAAGPYAGLVALTGDNTLTGTGNFGFVEVQGVASTTDTNATFTDLTVTSGGDFTAPAGTMTITGDFDASAGTFDANSGTTTFSGAGTYNLEFNFQTATSGGSGVGSPAGIFFKPDGTLMYVSNNFGSDTVDAYTLSTPWDVSTASFLNATSTLIDEYRGLSFSPNGLNMYTVGTGDDVVEQFTLSTPWDISTAAFTAASPGLVSGNSNGLFISVDGTRVYTAEGSGAEVNQYEMTTAWDVTSLTHVRAEAGAQQSDSPEGVTFSPDGRTMVTIDAGTVYLYTLPTPWNVSSYSFTDSFVVPGGESSEDITFSADGTYAYVVIGGTTDEVWQYDIATQVATTTEANTFANLEASSGSVTFTGSADIRDFTISANATVTAPSQLNIDGVFAQNGAFDANGGMITLTGFSSYDSASAQASETIFSIGTENTNPHGMVIENNGTKLYVVGRSSGGEVNEYTLSVPYDVTSASFVTATSVSGQEGQVGDLAFNTDGTKLFVVGEQSDQVHEYALSSAYDLSSASYVHATSVSSQSLNSADLEFSLDGSRMFVFDRNTDDAFQYNLGTAFDISTAAYSGHSLDASAQEANATGATFNDDGTRYYVIGTDQEIYEYALSEPYDLSSASFDSVGLVTASIVGSITDIRFDADGGVLYLLTGERDRIYQLTIAGSHEGSFVGPNALHDATIGNGYQLLPTASTSDITIGVGATLVANNILDIAGSLTNNGFVDARTGSQVFLSGTDQNLSGNLTADSALEGVVITGSYTLASDVEFKHATITAAGILTGASGTTTITGNYTNNGTFTANGGLVIAAATEAAIQDIVLATSTSLSAQTNNPRGIALNADGTKLYAVDSNGNVYEYDLTVPYVVGSASYLHATSVSAQENNLTDVAFNDTGTKMFVVGTVNDSINEYALSSAFDVSTAAFTASTSVLAQDGGMNGLVLSYDGTRLYTVGASNDEVFEYSLESAYDITNLSFERSTSVAPYILAPTGLSINRTGTKLLVIDEGLDVVVLYNLTTPHDVSSAVYVDQVNVGLEDGAPGDILLHPDGTIAYMLGRGTDDVFQYDLASPQTFAGDMTGANAFANLTQTGDLPLTFAERASTTGTFTLAQSAASVEGATTTIFNASSAYTFQNIDWQGSTTTSELVLRSSASGTQWFLNVPGSQINVEYVNVQDSNASSSSGGAITATSSTNSGNNINWIFVDVGEANAEEWNDTNWTLYDTITIDAGNIDDDLTDFPVYVDLADLSTDFWSSTPTSSAFVGTDIRITTGSTTGAIELPRELVSASSTAQTGELHFKADTISSTTDTVFFVWYNGTTTGDYAETATYGAQNVWSNDYVAVWHMAEDPSIEDVLDSTSNNLDATPGGSMTASDSVTGTLGQAIDFDGVNDVLDAGTQTLGLVDLNVSAWIVPDTFGESGFGRILDTSDNSTEGYVSYVRSSSASVSFFNEFSIAGRWDGPTITLDETLYYSTNMTNLPSTASNPNMFYDGSSVSVVEGSVPSGIKGVQNNSNVLIGNSLNGSRTFDGSIDELRLSSSTRSAAWISAEYTNQASTTNFYTINDEGTWNPSDWTEFDTISIRHEVIDSPLTDFPVYVNLEDLSSNFWSTVSDGGGDIRVTTNELNPQEVAREVVSASTTAETGELHFKAPRLSDVVDTSFRIYYNGVDDDYSVDQTYGAQNVWTNDYVYVSHDGGSTDSTQYDNDGTVSGTLVSNGTASGQLGEASEFNDSGYFDLSNSSILEVTFPLTLQVWANLPDSTNERFIQTDIHDSPAYGGAHLMTFSNALVLRTGDGAGSAESNRRSYSGGTVPSNEWAHLVGVFNSNTDREAFINGEAQTTTLNGGTASGIGYTSNPARVGAQTNAGFLTGTLDEVRISSSSRSADWIFAEYTNQSTTTDFYTLTVGGTGSSTIANHASGQVSDAFDFRSQTNGTLFAFNLEPVSGDATVDRIEFEVRGFNFMKQNTSDFTNIRLFRDLDNDRAYDATEPQIGGSGTFSLWTVNNQYGTIAFEGDFAATTTQNYILVSDWTAPPRGSQMTIDLKQKGIDALDTSGTVEIGGSLDSIQHSRNNRGGGGTSAQIGGPAPVGDGDVGGGGEGGGDDGGAIDTNTGGNTIGGSPDFYWATAQSGSWNSGANAIDQVDGTYATTSASDTHIFNDYDDPVPGGDTVEGIEVKLELSGTTAAGDVGIELSWNGGTSWTSSQNTPTLTTTDDVVTVGGASDDWGRTWASGEFSNANFRVRLTGNPSSNEIRVDAIQVRVYHQASGGSSGGGGGGGAI